MNEINQVQVINSTKIGKNHHSFKKLNSQDLNGLNIEKSLEKQNSVEERKEKIIIATSKKVSSKRISN